MEQEQAANEQNPGSWGTAEEPPTAAAPLMDPPARRKPGRPAGAGRKPAEATPTATAAVRQPKPPDEASVELAKTLYGALSMGMVMLCKSRGMEDEAASLGAFREEQVTPLLPASARILQKYMGKISDEAFVGIGIAQAAVLNFIAAANKQTEIVKARAA